jgi:hypothetical protein
VGGGTLFHGVSVRVVVAGVDEEATTRGERE